LEAGRRCRQRAWSPQPPGHCIRGTGMHTHARADKASRAQPPSGQTHHAPSLRPIQKGPHHIPCH
jgi:hypothetical protein